MGSRQCIVAYSDIKYWHTFAQLVVIRHFWRIQKHCTYQDLHGYCGKRKWQAFYQDCQRQVWGLKGCGYVPLERCSL